MRPDPVRQLLAGGRLGVGVAARPEDSDEELDRPFLADAPINDRGPFTREVDEGLLAGPMHLTHRRPEAPSPAPVDLAKLAVAVAVGMDLGILLPQELQRDPDALELTVDLRAIGPDPVPHRRGPRKQPGLERRIVQLGRHWPAHPAGGRPLQIERDRADADRAGVRHRPVAQAPVVLES